MPTPRPGLGFRPRCLPRPSQRGDMWTPDLGNPGLGAAWARTQRCQRWTEIGVCSKLPPGQRGSPAAGPQEDVPVLGQPLSSNGRQTVPRLRGWALPERSCSQRGEAGCAGDTGAAAEPPPGHSPSSGSWDSGGPWVTPGQSFQELPEGEWEKQLITAGGGAVRVGGPPGLPCSGRPSLSAQLESRFLEFSPASVTDSRLRKH